jgi:hypothetical protein
MSDRADGGAVLPMPTVLIVDRDHVVRLVSGGLHRPGAEVVGADTSVT